ncbi:MAG: VacB/RNase II family 3'-5' exoribonuclease [Planctomycetota bacterium]
MRVREGRGVRGGQSGRVVEVVERRRDTFVGSYLERAGRGLVRVDGGVFHRSIPVGDPGAKGARDGDKVVVQMLRFPTADRRGEGVLTEVLGPAGAPGVDELAIIREFELPEKFSDAALAEAADRANAFEAATAPSDVSDAEVVPVDRTDLTGESVVTIDPVDARDFDDAISLTRSDDGHWHLGVHIADVAAFVEPGSELDAEARRRATSVYLPGRVIPMLPELISNGLASLQEGRLRLTKTVRIEFDPDGVPVEVSFLNSAIRVRERFAYEQVLPVVEGADDAIEVSVDIKKQLTQMRDLAMTLRKRRAAAGMLEMALPEVKLQLDGDRSVSGAVEVDHDQSHQIIEEFMIAANVAVATKLFRDKTVFIRRSHPDPDEENLREFADYVGTLGFKLKRYQSRADLQKLIKTVAGDPSGRAVNYALLRSMKQAVYTIEADGHYALAEEHYCHFTSPIRRYADLTVHRLVDARVRGSKSKGESVEKLAETAARCSELSRRAEAAERELVRVKLFRYLEDKVGEPFTAVVTGIERFGMFCRGAEIPFEGLAHIRALGDLLGGYVDYDEATRTLFCRERNVSFTLGQELTVVITRVDLAARKLDLLPQVEGLEIKPEKLPTSSDDAGETDQRSSGRGRKRPENARGRRTGPPKGIKRRSKGKKGPKVRAKRKR